MASDFGVSTTLREKFFASKFVLKMIFRRVYLLMLFAIVRAI
jgi:hypothetical protein